MPRLQKITSLTSFFSLEDALEMIVLSDSFRQSNHAEQKVIFHFPSIVMARSLNQDSHTLCSYQTIHIRNYAIVG